MNTLDTKKIMETGCPVSIMTEMAEGELIKAVEKHPLFADKLSNLDKDMTGFFLSRQRLTNDKGEATGSSIFHEEWGEFLEAVYNGDADAARHELAQCMAMLLRIGIHIDDYIKSVNHEHA
jgi:DNA-binding GntR family transcriptional regulator